MIGDISVYKMCIVNFVIFIASLVTVTFDRLLVFVEEELEQDPAKVKQLILSKLGKIPEKVRALIENYELDGFISLPQRHRHPWELLRGNISKGNVCVLEMHSTP